MNESAFNQRRMILRILALLCISMMVLFFSSLNLDAQSAPASGSLEGTVMDSSGAVVPGAQVSVKNEQTGVASSQTADGAGHFIFLYLPPGKYELSVQKSGFQQSIIKDIAVSVGTTVTTHPALAVGQMQTSVNVSASATQVDTSQSSLGDVVGQQSIGALPLNGRNFTDFTLLTPGATTDGDFGMVSFNGIAGNFNNYSVDGANNNNAFFEQQIGRTSIPFQFSEDVVQEFQVTSTGFTAEFGQAGGGLVNTVTKSGGNQVHGDAYYYLLDSAFNANDSINNREGIPKPHNRRQQFGVSVGGPIIRDKLFYYGNYEGQVRNEPLTVNNAPALVGLPPNFFSQYPDIAKAVQAASGSFARSFNQNTAFFKVNGLWGQRNTFSATYNYQRFRSPHGYFNTPTSTGDGLSLTDGATSQFFQFTLQTAFNPRTVNEFRFHFGNDTHLDLPASPATVATTTIQNPDTGFVFGGNRFQLSTGDRRYELADNFTHVVGRHTLKAGVDININHDTDYFVYGPKGEYRFGSLADVATGAFELYLQSFGQYTDVITSPTYSVFAQDQFRATPRLTLNYGLRYDLQVLPQPPVCNPAFTMTCTIPYGKKNFAPRFGFAYSLDAQGTTVVRGSFGLFYAQEDLLDVSHVTVSNGVSQQFLVVVGPGFGNNNPIVTYPNSLTSFPSGAGGTPSLGVFATNFRSPYVEQANLQVEHQFGAHTTLSVGYVYSHGLRLLGNSNGVTRQANGNLGVDINLVPPELQPAFGGSFTTDTVTLPNGNSYVVPDFEAIDGLVNPNFGPINIIDNTGKSIYHGMVVSLQHSSRQFFTAVSYTLSKTIDQGTGYFNQFDLRSERGLSQLDQRHRFVLSGSWSPVYRPLRDFTFAGVVTLASGRPYTAVFDTPQLNFSVVPGEGYNSFTGPGVADVDFSIARVFKLSERMSLKVMAESFDIFNHANYQQNTVDNVQYTTTQLSDNAGNALPVWTASPNPDFGAPLAVVPRYGSRSFQFSARFNF